MIALVNGKDRWARRGRRSTARDTPGLSVLVPPFPRSLLGFADLLAVRFAHMTVIRVPA